MCHVVAFRLKIVPPRLNHGQGPSNAETIIEHVLAGSYRDHFEVRVEGRNELNEWQCTKPSMQQDEVRLDSDYTESTRQVFRRACNVAEDAVLNEAYPA